MSQLKVININLDEILDIIFYIFDVKNDDNVLIDFMLFCRLFYLIYNRYYNQHEDDFNEYDLSKIHGSPEKNIMHSHNEDYTEHKVDEDDIEDEY